MSKGTVTVAEKTEVPMSADARRLLAQIDAQNEHARTIQQRKLAPDVRAGDTSPDDTAAALQAYHREAGNIPAGNYMFTGDPKKLDAWYIARGYERVVDRQIGKLVDTEHGDPCWHRPKAIQRKEQLDAAAESKARGEALNAMMAEKIVAPEEDDEVERRQAKLAVESFA